MTRNERLQTLRTVLLTRREALRRALAGDLSALQHLREQSSGDLLDAALDSANDEINSQIVEVESRELAQIEKALNRMDEGSYGVCEVTGKPIPIERLEALPYATMTVEAQREMERAIANGEGENADWSKVITFDTSDTLPSFDDFNFNFA